MLAFIEGQVVAETPQGVIIENRGLGYDILTTRQVKEQLTPGQRCQAFHL